ncbi:MAG: hypothetical protein E6G21_01675 [Actinobacteria bacterium]|nr:MAG: hypothetical protein E6G21_01675 [Actinomycetota bacterium]
MRRGGRATVVIEPPSLPIPTAHNDPRRAAIRAVVDELERAGIPVQNQTLLVAGGLARRLADRDLEQLGIVSPEFARRFRGRVAIHDAEDPGLVEIGHSGRIPLRVHPALLDTDVIVVVTAAETVLHGGPAALLAASGREALRAAGAYSLLETSASQGWQLGVAIERELSRRVPLIGASLTFNHPRLAGAARGYPYEQEALERIVGSPLRRPFGLLPAWARDRIIRSVRRDLSLAAAYGGPPSVAHAEALLRGVEARSAPLDGQLDAIVIGIPRTTPFLPRERPNPLLAAYLALGLALRMWRDGFPLADGGTAIVLHRFHRRFSHPTQQPYRAFFQATTRFGRESVELLEAEREAADDPRAIDAYRGRRSCHPLLPFADRDGAGDGARPRRGPAPRRLPPVTPVLPDSRNDRPLDQDLREELLRPLLARFAEEVFGRALLDDPPVVHHHDAVGGLTGKAHLVGDDDHGHPFERKLLHHVQDLADHLRVERARRLVEED